MEDQQEQAGDPSHAVNIFFLAQLLREKRAAANRPPVQLAGGSPLPCNTIICIVGDRTREGDEVEYDPQYVSIGPYHHPNPKLARDDDKLRSLSAVLAAASPGCVTHEEVYLQELAPLEDQARACYDNRFDMASVDFLRMLLLDGCYVLDRFTDLDGRRRRNAAAEANGHVLPGEHHGAGGFCDKMVEARAGMPRDVFYLAENQIPFFVVDKIHQLTVGGGGVSAAATIAGYVRDPWRTQQYTTLVPPTPQSGNLLHLLHMHLKPDALPSSATGGEATGEPLGRWRTATEYYFAGVGFENRPLGTVGSRCILDVRLDSGGGVPEVPCLNIDAETWPFLRNLMALEQRNPEATGSYVTAYCVFMSQVASDVELLSRRGIIVHGMGSHGEVAQLFADLCKGIMFNLNDPGKNYLRATGQALEKRFQSRIRRWAAWLGRKHFDNPWLTAATCAAVVQLTCAVVQAVYSVLSSRKERIRNASTVYEVEMSLRSTHYEVLFSWSYDHRL